MQALCPRPHEHTAIRTDLKAIFVSLELSHSTWVITSLAPGGEKMSKHAVPSGDIAALLARLSKLKEKARLRTGHHQFSFWVFGMRRCGLARVGENEALLSRAGAVEASRRPGFPGARSRRRTQHRCSGLAGCGRSGFGVQASRGRAAKRLRRGRRRCGLQTPRD